MESIDFKFQNICRACKLEAKQMLSIYQQNVVENNMLTPADMLMACTSLKVSPTDGMPREMCIKCLEQLKSAFTFKKQCEETDTFLRQYLLSTTIKIEENAEPLETTNSEIQNNNKIKVEPPDINVETTTTTTRSGRKRGRSKKTTATSEEPSNSINKDLKVMLRNIGNDGPDDPKYEVSKRGRLRKSVVKYEVEDDFSDSAFDFAEVDAAELLDANMSSDPEWNNSDNENVKIKKDVDTDKDDDNDNVENIIKKEKKTTKKEKNLTKSRRKNRGRPRKNSSSETTREQRTYECSKCSMVFRNKLHFKQHESTHDDEKPFICEICPQKFSRRDFLIEHTRSHLNELNHNCEICGQKLETIEQLAKHKFSKHSAVPTKSQQQAVKKVDKEKYKCDLCGKMFSSMKHRENHVYLAHNKIYYCKTCTLPFRGREQFYLHNTRSNECSKKYLCPDCGARFSATSALKVHIRRHRGEKPFKCQYCEKGFSRKFDLITHETRHRGEKNHLCTICGKGFNRRHMLTIHMRTHTGEKPYKCCYCDAAFTQNNDLKTHIRRHTGERFTCDLCDEKFLMHYLLSKHKRIVHGIDIPPAKPILERIGIPQQKPQIQSLQQQQHLQQQQQQQQQQLQQQQQMQLQGLQPLTQVLIIPSTHQL